MKLNLYYINVKLLIMYGYRHLTKKRQKDEELMFDDVDERRKRRQRRKTKTKTKTKDENEDEDERRKRRSKKNRRREKKKIYIYFKTNVLVPKTTVIRKEEGATVAATPTFSQRAVVRPDRQRSSMEGPKTVGNSH